ncbi:MAG TPA: hypothetical protein VMJ11_24565 [Paraburkholderia sp.]|nr:hypothetical protein [Paraburkholderia sp.]HTR09772.1 hypothetical protein [Paraburkholderia sp.]
MWRREHAEEQIVRVLKQAKLGAVVVDACKKMSASVATFYN